MALNQIQVSVYTGSKIYLTPNKGHVMCLMVEIERNSLGISNE